MYPPQIKPQWEFLNVSDAIWISVRKYQPEDFERNKCPISAELKKVSVSLSIFHITGMTTNEYT